MDQLTEQTPVEQGTKVEQSTTPAITAPKDAAPAIQNPIVETFHATESAADLRTIMKRDWVQRALQTDTQVSQALQETIERLLLTNPSYETFDVMYYDIARTNPRFIINEARRIADLQLREGREDGQWPQAGNYVDETIGLVTSALRHLPAEQQEEVRPQIEATFSTLAEVPQETDTQRKNTITVLESFFKEQPQLAASTRELLESLLPKGARLILEGIIFRLCRTNPRFIINEARRIADLQLREGREDGQWPQAGNYVDETIGLVTSALRHLPAEQQEEVRPQIEATFSTLAEVPQETNQYQLRNIARTLVRLLERQPQLAVSAKRLLEGAVKMGNEKGMQKDEETIQNLETLTAKLEEINSSPPESA